MITEQRGVIKCRFGNVNELSFDKRFQWYSFRVIAIFKKIHFFDKIQVAKKVQNPFPQPAPLTPTPIKKKPSS